MNNTAAPSEAARAARWADETTNRLVLHPVDEQEAERILGGVAGADDAWAAGYPFEGDLQALGAFLAATVAGGEQRPWGYYQLRRRDDGRAIGGIGFKGAPDASGAVEVGYGLAPDARGHGYAAEALRGMMRIARANGARVLKAETTSENVASQRTLRNVGMPRRAVDGDAWQYELAL